MLPASSDRRKAAIAAVDSKLGLLKAGEHRDRTNRLPALASKQTENGGRLGPYGESVGPFVSMCYPTATDYAERTFRELIRRWKEPRETSNPTESGMSS